MFIALDIGTTNIKAVAFGDSEAVLETVERSSLTLAPQSGWSEQAPELVFASVLESLKELLLKTVHYQAFSPLQGIVFSSAMHGLVAVDASGEPLTNFMLWSDVRAVEEARLLREQGGGMDIYRRTGVPIHPMSPLLKLVWLRKNQPDVFQNTHKFLGVKEFVWHRLTGKFESDLSCASATGLMNLHDNLWDERAMKVAGISEQHLPALVAPTHIAYSRLEMLPGHIPLIIGASDGALSNLGADALEPGHASVTIGTSAAIRVLSDEIILDEHMRTFCYRLDANRCIVGGASNNGANALEWLRNSVIKSSLDMETFANQALEVPAGADGLRFFPYLLGERAPLWDAGAKAGFTGLSAQHTQAHFVRAVMEGVLFNLKSITDVLEEKIPVQALHINGGFARNQLWVSMMQDIFQKRIEPYPYAADAAVRGALLLGKAALGC